MKSVGNFSLTTLDEFMDYVAYGDTDHSTPAQVYRNLAWIYRDVEIIADTVAGIPFAIYRGEDLATQSGRNYQDVTGILPYPEDVLTFVAASTQLLGQAYLSKFFDNPIWPGLRPLAASTIRFEDVRNDKLYFTRTVNGALQPMTSDDLVYIWLLDPTVELGPPQAWPVKAALTSANVLVEMGKFTAGYFASGATKRIILATPNKVDSDERKRIKKWWERRKTWSTEVINADGIKPIIVGEGLSELSDDSLTRAHREDIDHAMGIPSSISMSGSAAGMGGGGVMTADERHFYDKKIVPLSRYIFNVLNRQQFNAMGYSIVPLFDTLDIYQTDENERANSFGVYVSHGMAPDIAATMLGLEVPAAAAPEATAAFAQPEPQPATPEVKTVTCDADLARWRAFAVRRFKENQPTKACEFDSKTIPTLLQTIIRTKLADAATVADVKAIFSGSRPPDQSTKRAKAIDAEGPARAADEAALQAELQAIFDQYDQDALPYVRGDADEQPDYSAMQAALFATLLTYYTQLAERNAFDVQTQTQTFVDPDALDEKISAWANQQATERATQLIETTHKFVDDARNKYVSEMTTEQTEALLKKAFGAQRAETISISAVSRGLTGGVLILSGVYTAMGLEVAVTWNTKEDERVCKLCGPLHEKPQEVWAREAPDGPGTIHPRCRCYPTIELRRRE